MDVLVIGRSGGQNVKLGVIEMRLIASSENTGGSFALAEFRGAEGPWTVPHVHERLEESFYVLDGSFTFTIGGRDITAAKGDYLLVPRGTPHVMRGGPGGGALLTLFVPGGLERMFVELGKLPPESITDPRARAEISKRHDSRPV